jgi:hypothetical protein
MIERKHALKRSRPGLKSCVCHVLSCDLGQNTGFLWTTVSAFENGKSSPSRVDMRLNVIIRSRSCSLQLVAVIFGLRHCWCAYCASGPVVYAKGKMWIYNVAGKYLELWRKMLLYYYISIVLSYSHLMILTAAIPESGLRMKCLVTLKHWIISSIIKWLILTSNITSFTWKWKIIFF